MDLQLIIETVMFVSAEYYCTSITIYPSNYILIKNNLKSTTMEDRGDYVYTTIKKRGDHKYIKIEDTGTIDGQLRRRVKTMDRQL